MAYATPFTAVAGTVWKAADWNVYGRDNIAWLATDSPACRAYKSAVQSVSSATNTALSLDSERFDNASMHSTSSNTSRITVPTGGGGKYLIGGALYFTAAAGGTNRSSWVQLNGASRVGQNESPFNATSNTNATPTTSYALSAADYVELYVNQDSGGAINVGGPLGVGAEFYAFWFRN